MKSNAYSLQIKLVLSLFMFTMIMTAVVTSIEMYSQYRQGIAELYDTFDRIREAHGSTLSQNLWRFDERSLEIQMQSIVNENAVTGVTLTDNIKGTRSMGNTVPSGKVITVSYPLVGEDAKDILGVMTIYGTDEILREGMVRQIPRTILSELTKTVTAALFLLILFYMLFGRHLNRIISYTDSLSLQNLDEKLSLRRYGSRNDPDELDRLTLAINHMTGRIQEDFAERRQAEQMIAAKNRELEQIVYVASHDLRSPLVNVDGYSRELEFFLGDITRVMDEHDSADCPVEKVLLTEIPDIRNALQLIRNSTRQMDKLLKGLLQLSRSGRESLTLETVNARALLDRVLSTFDYQFREQGIVINVDPLPPCWADDTQLGQIFSNLISNAVKYRDSEKALTITISGREHGGHVTYCVEDTGIGIAKEHQEKVFELFHRLDPSSNEGDGLGLTIVRQSLWRMDGTIRVESEPGQGSCFLVTLPSATRNNRSYNRVMDNDGKGE